MSASIKALPSLPTELWTSILRWSTIESERLSPQPIYASFGWPYETNFDSSFFRSIATKRNLVLVSRQFREIALEFLYETLHLGGTRKTVALGQQCLENTELVNYLRSWTKSLYIIPVFKPVTTEPEVDEVDNILRMLLFITQSCTRLQNVVVRADTITPFHEPTYQPWVQILDALPSGLRHLSVENFLLGPVVWKAQLLSSWNTSSALRTLRLEAEFPPFEHHFPYLTHLWLFSWPTASKWHMPSLSHLYIEYFPGNDSTSSFWTMMTRNLKNTQLKLLHFGGDTDFGLYFPDLPQRLQQFIPNLEVLEYHYAGDVDILWDPAELPESLERVTVRLQDVTEDAGHVDSHLIAEDVLSAGSGILQEMPSNLCPSGAHRWLRIERHLEAYCSHPVKLFVILPHRITSLSRLDPLISSSRVSTIGVNGI